jgi:hypothetical protein
MSLIGRLIEPANLDFSASKLSNGGSSKLAYQSPVVKSLNRLLASAAPNRVSCLRNLTLCLAKDFTGFCLELLGKFI